MTKRRKLSGRPSEERSATPTSARKRRKSSVNGDTTTPVAQMAAVDLNQAPPEDQAGTEKAALGSKDPIGSGRTYFEAHRGPVATSNFTLADLFISTPDELSQASKLLQDPFQAEHQRIAQEFNARHSEYQYLLDAGHSLLFYGFGSKKDILDEFARHLSSFSDVIVIDGFNPTLSLRNALTSIASDILSVTSFSKRSLLDVVDTIRDTLAEKKSMTLTVVIHNIDGPSLRSSDSQLVLSRLAGLSQIRLAATVDHVNAPLLWDAPMYTAFSWLWVKVHTFRHYKFETFFSAEPLLRGGGERRVEGAVAFLTSLTDRSRAVFRELASRQFRARNDSTGGGRTTFNDLFAAVKEQFLVSDTDTLRNILNELQTHDLLVTRRGADAAEQMSIPLQKAQLKAVLQEIGLEV